MLPHLKRPAGDPIWVVSSFGELTTRRPKSPSRNAAETKSKTRTLDKLLQSRVSLKSCPAPPSTGHVGSSSSHSKTSRSAHELWVDKHQPQLSEDQLAVHKKKYQEVRCWFEAQKWQPRPTMSSISQRSGDSAAAAAVGTSLLLTGPAGSAKTATVRLLAKKLGFDVREWINRPGVVAHYSHGQQQFDESQAVTFRDFLLRTGQYSSQIFVGDDHKKKLIMIEDFPTVFAFRVEELHNILRAYFKVSTSPIVFIVTDRASSASNERNLFPPHFQHEINITHISFNPVAATNMFRALRTIADAESLDVSKETLDLLVESSRGDIRSAVNALQFTYDVGATMTSKTAVRPIKKAKTRRDQPAKKSRVNVARPALATATAARDDSLFLFHVLGKILHCKRDIQAQPIPTSTLPSNFKPTHRFPLLVNPEEVFDRSSTSASSFGAFLHQNYPPFFTDIDDVSHVSKYLSLSDIFLGDYTGLSELNAFAVSIATRGIMYFRREKISGGFRPIHKPKFFSVQQSCKVSSEAARNLFAAKYFNLSRGDLFTDIIPYLGKYMTSALTQEQKAFISNSFQPYSGRIFAKAQLELLNENEVESLATTEGDVEVDVDRLKSGIFTSVDSVELVASVEMNFDDDDDDHEFVIEEFDD